MYVMGENPAMSDPDVDHAREALADARSPGRAGHLPHRDGVPRRRGAAGDRVAREDRHRHQHRPHGAARPQGDRAAGRRAGRTSGSSTSWRARMGLDWHYAHPRDVFDEMRTVHGLDRRHHLGAARARVVGHLSVREGRRSRASRSCSSTTSRRATRPRAASFPPTSSPAAERPDARVSDGADHRAPARALAHRLR